MYEGDLIHSLLKVVVVVVVVVVFVLLMILLNCESSCYV